MDYAPEPTTDQLQSLARDLSSGGTAVFERRILGGLGCTMDVLRVTDASNSEFRAILRRRGMWSPDDDIAAAQVELDVLRLMRASEVPAPEPLWIDSSGIFDEPATVISFIEGRPLMAPDNPISYTTQLARMLVRIHDVSPGQMIRRRLRDYNRLEIEGISGGSPPDRVAAHHLGEQVWRAQRAELRRAELESGVFVHGDYWPGNTLWRGEQLVAVVDFEEIGVGDPALDVATAVINYRFEPWGDAADNFLQVYRAETGRILESLRFWYFKELKRPMPDIGRWLPSFREMSSNPDITLEELRRIHDSLILEELGE